MAATPVPAKVGWGVFALSVMLHLVAIGMFQDIKRGVALQPPSMKPTNPQTSARATARRTLAESDIHTSRRELSQSQTRAQRVRGRAVEPRANICPLGGASGCGWQQRSKCIYQRSLYPLPPSSPRQSICTDGLFCVSAAQRAPEGALDLALLAHPLQERFARQLTELVQLVERRQLATAPTSMQDPPLSFPKDWASKFLK